ncbi:cytochrome oxidase assembly protein [Glutamicibacter halophytocola]|uniref:Heme A synthase n=1 Tax=Glutamicibacter halophytocola TaxID=1933880 RepID=A0ABX5Y750_9MICC|nr:MULTISPECIES: COX15/CtaA family protein [Glutamicibacter]ALG29241.1 cytochrome oxidase assembly protein [Glutamicibacter halophytocola]MBF6673354.1 heme A synthase [Glutamicibacter sp. FBE19]QDY65505.1 heme A synthase [Glutamicibacter halophytocola]
MSSDLATRSWADKLPTKVTRLVHGLAIASLISQVGIIVTGGAVRLTESGLGCSHWPNCVPGSMTPVPAMGIHGIIEFGNRTLTFVLLAIAIGFLLSVWSMRRTHSTVFKLGLALLLGIPAQGVIGGITVWTGLNPWVVSLHFLLSGTLVILATLLVNRTRAEIKAQENPPTTKTIRQTATAAWIFGILAVIMGTIVTGTGPHAGDATTPRHMFDPLLVTRMHTAPVYLLIIATAALLVLAYKTGGNDRLRASAWWLVAVILLQAAIGYTQHFTGLPIGLVLLHMLGASLLLVSSTDAWDRATLLPKYQRVDN